MADQPTPAPESTAARVALWRALHVLADAPPPVLADTVGLELLAPLDGWRERGDMHPQGTSTFRASIVARARFIEDLVEAEAAKGVGQYVILGAGVDTFAQRRPELASRLQVFEVDQPAPQAWKRQRLMETGHGVPDWLHLVPVDFEADWDWRARLQAAGFEGGETVASLPFVRRRSHPVAERLQARLDEAPAVDEGLVARIESFLEAHPVIEGPGYV